MPASRFGKTLNQGVGLGIEKDQMDGYPAALELRQIAGQFGERRPAAHVDADRHLFVALLCQELDQTVEQLGREVVDAVIGIVLEDIERDALSGSRKAADDDKLHGGWLAPCGSAAPAQLLFLALDEFLGAVDAAQLQDVIAHRRLGEYCQIATRSDGQHDLANADAHDVLGACIERQAIQPRNHAADRFFHLHDELQVFLSPHRGLAENGADIEHPESANLQKILQQFRASALERFGRDVVELHNIVSNQSAASRYQFQRQFALAHAAFAGDQHAHPQHIQEYAVSRDEFGQRTPEIGAHHPDDLQAVQRRR